MKPDILMYKKRQLKQECADPNYWLQSANLYWRTMEETESEIIRCKQSMKAGIGHPMVMKAKLRAMKQHLKNLKNGRKN